MINKNFLNKRKILFTLVIFHIVIITASNYLVQLPVTLFGYHTTWGAFTFPFIILATDLTVRIFGAQPARWIVFYAMLPALVISYVITVLFLDGKWTSWSSLMTFSPFVARIALASFVAYLVGQLMDIFVFNKLRQQRVWYVAPIVSMIAGNAIDTVTFFSVAFYQTSNAFLAEHLVEIAFIDYLFKIVICLVFFVPLYGILLNQLITKFFSLTPDTPLNSTHQLSR